MPYVRRILHPSCTFFKNHFQYQRTGVVPRTVCSDDRVSLFRSPAVALVNPGAGGEQVEPRLPPAPVLAKGFQQGWTRTLMVDSKSPANGVFDFFMVRTPIPPFGP